MSDATHSCENCSATIYPEHIAKRQAGRVGGKLLCAMCVQEKIKEMKAAGSTGTTTSSVLAGSGVVPSAARAGAAVVMEAPPHKPPAPRHEDETLTLIEESPEAESNAPKPQIRSFNASSLASGDRHDKFTRGLVDASVGATRAHSFHCKLSDASLSYMDNQINEWVDAHPEVHIKFASSTIGNFEAKTHHEAHLIVTVFY